MRVITDVAVGGQQERNYGPHVWSAMITFENLYEHEMSRDDLSFYHQALRWFKPVCEPRIERRWAEKLGVEATYDPDNLFHAFSPCLKGMTIVRDEDNNRVRVSVRAEARYND